MNYLLAVDLEGIHGVIGEPYKGLGNDVFDYKLACSNAVKEVNIVTKALFDSGADSVTVWDNHGGGGNLNANDLDDRVTLFSSPVPQIERMNFASDNTQKILFIGYHSKEGTLDGVLAHTYSSVNLQYIKINGFQVGEVEIDTYIAGEKNIAPIYLSSDDKCIEQTAYLLGDIETVCTKRGLGRNSAELYGDEVLKEMYEKTLKATTKPSSPKKLKFPCEVEIRYTRTELAKEKKEFFYREYSRNYSYGEDAHVLKFNANCIEDIKIIL